MKGTWKVYGSEGRIIVEWHDEYTGRVLKFGYHPSYILLDANKVAEELKGNRNSYLHPICRYQDTVNKSIGRIASRLPDLDPGEDNTLEVTEYQYGGTVE